MNVDMWGFAAAALIAGTRIVRELIALHRQHVRHNDLRRLADAAGSGGWVTDTGPGGATVIHVGRRAEPEPSGPVRRRRQGG